MAGLILLVDTITPNSDKISQLTGGLGWHIILSILAYSILIIAAIQAILLYMQNKQLKSHNTSGLVKALPPLQTMDALLFEMIWIGMVLLTAAFVIGWPYIIDIQGQHLLLPQVGPGVLVSFLCKNPIKFFLQILRGPFSAAWPVYRRRTVETADQAIRLVSFSPKIMKKLDGLRFCAYQ